MLRSLAGYTLITCAACAVGGFAGVFLLHTLNLNGEAHAAGALAAGVAAGVTCSVAVLWSRSAKRRRATRAETHNTQSG